MSSNISDIDRKDSRRIKVFDTTLRDGQQCPGAAMSFENNIRYFRLASKMGIDIIEAGFPAASAQDFEIVKTIAEESAAMENSPVIAALCQLRKEQVEKTIEALKPTIASGRGRLHTYVPVDPELMAASLGSYNEKREEIIKDVYELTKMAADAGLEVQFSPEGYSRMGENFDFTFELIKAAIEGGATIINCPDTIGGASQLQGKDYFVEHMKRHRDMIEEIFPDKEICWSVHCHNDFGLAVQNTINAVFDGVATQIEGCINGVGERAGNASIEQCIMIIDQFGNRTEQGCQSFYTEANLKMIQEVSDFIGEYMLKRQPHWPVTGDNAARHSSGGHTNAILKNPMAYQPFDPRRVGKEISFTFGPLSGGNHARSVIENHGYICEESEKAAIAQFIKDQTRARRKGISDDELIKQYFSYRQPMQIDSVDYSRQGKCSKVTLEGKFFGKEGCFEGEHSGNDSALAALKKLVESEFGETRIIRHESYSDSSGINAHSVSTIILEDEFGFRTEGQAKNQDIEISALYAYIDAVNKSYVYRNFARERKGAASSTAGAVAVSATA